MRRRSILSLPFLPLAACTAARSGGGAGGNGRAEAAAARVLPELETELRAKGLAPGRKVYLRAFKESSELEIWMMPESGAEWVHFKTWPIARWSGRLGPKLREGDGQTPEGFYHTDTDSLNPRSRFHLSFDVNYPNAWDKARDRNGSLIMIHGSDVSIGCLAMTDPAIEQIYTLVAVAIAGGQQRVPVHFFPFRMTPARLDKAAIVEEEKIHLPFWREIEPGWSFYEENRRVPQVAVAGGRYIIRAV
jgi:murein L,D-transpeptidase YafK